MLLASSEPYPFHRKRDELLALDRPVAIVDGESLQLVRGAEPGLPGVRGVLNTINNRRSVMRTKVRWLLEVSALLALAAGSPVRDALAQDPATDPRPAPNRAEGEGPFERLIIRNATLIDGTGAPPRGPVDIVIERNRIKAIVTVGATAGDMRPAGRPERATKEIDATGMYVLPGFVDLHLHSGDIPKTPDAEYVYKLWMAHGITAGRGVPFASPVFSEREKARSARNEITAPRMFTYRLPFDEWEGSIETPEKAREWVRTAAATGIDGLKLNASPPEIMAALIDEATKLGLGTTAHLSQQGVAQMNVRDAARLGLGTVTHFYGLFEALYDGHDVQPWPPSHNHADEQHRFGQVARQWNLIHERGSPEWKALLEELKERNVILDPTMTAYLASRDVMARRNADWHETVHPALALGLLSAQPGEPRLLLLRLDQLGRGGVAQLLPGVDVLPQRLQEHWRPGHGQLRRRIHLQHLRFLHHRGDGAAAGGGVPSARSDPGSDDARRPGAARAEEEAHRVRRGTGGPARRPRRRARESGRQPQGALRNRRGAPQ